MKRFRRELSINMVFHKGIFRNNQIMIFPCFTVSKRNYLTSQSYRFFSPNVDLT